MKGESPLAIFYNHTLRSLWISSNIQKTWQPENSHTQKQIWHYFKFIWFQSNVKKHKNVNISVKSNKKPTLVFKIFFLQIINFLTDFELRRWKREMGRCLWFWKYSSCLNIFMQNTYFGKNWRMKNLLEEIINISISLFECMTEIPWPLADIHRSIGASQLTWKLNKYCLTISS